MADDLDEEHRGTRDRILSAAQALFAERGFETVSLRDITGAADANVAAVNYHFGSKENLIDAVVELHITPINEERMRLLDECERRQEGGVVSVEQILESFLAPVLHRISSGRMSEDLFCKFMGRLMGERGYRVPESVAPLLQAMAARFTAALRKAVPMLTEQMALWRMHFSFGVMANTLTHADTLKEISGGRAGDPPVEDQFRHIIAFCASGIRAETKGISGE